MYNIRNEHEEANKMTEEERVKDILDAAKWIVSRIHQSILGEQIVDISNVSDLILASYFLGRWDELTPDGERLQDALAGKDLLEEVLKLKTKITIQKDTEAIKALDDTTKWMLELRPAFFQ